MLRKTCFRDSRFHTISSVLITVHHLLEYLLLFVDHRKKFWVTAGMEGSKSSISCWFFTCTFLFVDELAEYAFYHMLVFFFCNFRNQILAHWKQCPYAMFLCLLSLKSHPLEIWETQICPLKSHPLSWLFTPISTTYHSFCNSFSDKSQCLISVHKNLNDFYKNGIFFNSLLPSFH